MTERSRASVSISSQTFEIGPNTLEWRGDALTIDIRETCTPWPLPVEGRITIHAPQLVDAAFAIDAAGRHTWRPLCPHARVEAAFSSPGVAWSGDGYLDANFGDEGLEDGFDFWDWSRFHLSGGETAVLYNTTATNGDAQSLAGRFMRNGDFEPLEPPPEARLPPTAIWRIRRRTRSENAPPRIIKTLEDTPFYSRSIVETGLYGRARRGFHETLDGRRLKLPIVQRMLPYRMPRLA